MSRSRLACVAIAALVLIPISGNTFRLGARQQQPSFHAGVDVVSLQVTVTDGGGRPIPHLHQTDFDVFEDGIKQDVEFFSATGGPLALSLLLDTSGSMEQSLPVVQEAAAGFARALQPDDVAIVMGFANRVHILQDFTADRQAVETAVRGTRAAGSTSVFEAVYVALQQFKRLGPSQETGLPRRDAIVLLSDGTDTSSLIDFDTLIDAARRSAVAIYTIELMPRAAGPEKKDDAAAFVLRRLAQETGGRAFLRATLDNLAAVYAGIREELSNQYSLTYQSSNRRDNGQWRRILVRVKRADTIARTRPGYYAPRLTNKALLTP